MKGQKFIIDEVKKKKKHLQASARLHKPFWKPNKSKKHKLIIHHIKRKENEDYTVNNRF